MTTYEDLAVLDYFGAEVSGSLRAIGWLGRDQEFECGEVPRSFYEKLAELISKRFSPVSFAGLHGCELCQFDGPAGVSNVFVPAASKLLVCPELIQHYINAHHYRPPARFQDAVMKCPMPGTGEYRKLFLAAGGGALLPRRRHRE